MDREYHLKKVYPGIERPDYGDTLSTTFALKYEKRMCEAWQKLG